MNHIKSMIDQRLYRILFFDPETDQNSKILTKSQVLFTTKYYREYGIKRGSL